MKNVFLFFVFYFTCFTLVYSQESSAKKEHEFSISYFGELMFSPGIELNYHLKLLDLFSEESDNALAHAIYLRPSLTYYRLTKYTNNYMPSLNLEYQFTLKNDEKGKAFSLAPYAKLGYLRYSYIGEIYESNNKGGFEERRNGGGSAFVFGGGLNLTGSIKRTNLNWLAGTEYFSEVSEDKLFINHVALRLGLKVLIQP